MKNDDYGFYGKGLDGYVHYRQGMQEAARNAPNASASLSPQSRKQPSLHRNPTNPVRSASGSCSIRCIRRA